MSAASNVHFVRSTKVRRSEVINLNGKWIWDGCNATFSRIDALCGEGASRIFAEPNVKTQDDGEVVNVAWFGSHDDDAKDLGSIDRAKLARVEDELVQRLEALRPALADPEIGPTVAAMLNLYDHKSIVAVGEHAILTDWGVIPDIATSSPSAYARHSDASIGRFLKSDMSPRLPGKTWSANGAIDAAAHAQPARDRASAAHPTISAAAAATTILTERRPSRWWIPAALVVFFGALLAYVAWPGNLIYDKQIIVEESVLAQLNSDNQDLTQKISSLKTELSKDACAIDPALVGLPARDAAAATPAIDGAADMGTTE